MFIAFSTNYMFISSPNCVWETVVSEIICALGAKDTYRTTQNGMDYSPLISWIGLHEL